VSANPMIEEGRIKFAGLSSESFELPDIGDEVTYTVRGRVTSHLEREMADEGQRVTATVKVIRVVEGISKRVNDPEDGQGSLIDGEGKVADPDEEQESEGEAENVTSISKATGPQFSGGDA
jgi:hypothetical protein